MSRHFRPLRSYRSSRHLRDSKEEEGQRNTTVNNSIQITIPKGAANPEVDITNLEPRQWYVPQQITINEREIASWTNKDTEAHTVTSDRGSGIESLLTNKQGKTTGIFDSGLFKAGDHGHIISQKLVGLAISALFILGWKAQS